VEDLWKASRTARRKRSRPVEDELLEIDQDCTVTRYPYAAGGRRPQGVPDGGHAETALPTAGRAPRAPREV